MNIYFIIRNIEMACEYSMLNFLSRCKYVAIKVQHAAILLMCRIRWFREIPHTFKNMWKFEHKTMLMYFCSTSEIFVNLIEPISLNISINRTMYSLLTRNFIGYSLISFTWLRTRIWMFMGASFSYMPTKCLIPSTTYMA